ncbi:MAG: hypothetical protein KBD78_14465 [Oligoflexales bacterium]|nr:hypothetical protein [Oligoflexales bacterium]
MNILFGLLLRSTLVLAFISLATMALVGVASAATIQSCSADSKRCVAKMEAGVIGDRVEVTDDKARPVAQAFIVKRKGNFALIKIEAKDKEIKIGYPVILRKNSAAGGAQWAAAFSFSSGN